jgi:hypothetical protein
VSAVLGVDTVLGVDAGCADLREADHLVREAVARCGLPEGTFGSTHFVHIGRPHVTVAVTLPPDGDAERRWAEVAGWDGVGVAWGERRCGPPEWSAGAAAGAAELAARRSGRVVLFPGVERLTGTVPIGSVVDGTAIDRVVVLGASAEPAATDLLRTRDHVRPEWRDGVLVLSVVAAGGGGYLPFEVPNPTPCCADHR